MGVEPDRDQVTTVHDEELEISPLSDDNDTAPTKLSAKVWPAGGVSDRWDTITSNEQTLINIGTHAHMAWTAIPDPPCNVCYAIHQHCSRPIPELHLDSNVFLYGCCNSVPNLR